MSLRDPHDLLDVLDRLENLRDRNKNSGQRQFQRQTVRNEAEIIPADQRGDRMPVMVQVRDISWGGLGFICTQHLPVNTFWRVHFLSHGLIVGQTHIMVRHCRRVDDGCYLLGGQFVADPGLLHVLGVHMQDVKQPEQSDSLQVTFLPPAEVA